MPFIRFKGFNKEDVERLSESIIEKSSEIIEVPKQLIKLELLNIETITPNPCTVEIYMFQREPDKHHALANSLYQIISQAGYKDAHIFFVMLTEAYYYKQGQPLTNYPYTQRQQLLKWFYVKCWGDD